MNQESWFRRNLVWLTLGLIAAAVTGAIIFLIPRSNPLPRREFVQNLVGDRQIEVVPPNNATIIMTGDIMLSRNVAAAVARAQDPLLPFAGLRDLLASSDLNVANLESPFSGRATITPTGSLVFNAPTSTVRGLVDYNFGVLNLANNHALDQGEAGLAYTRNFLRQNNLQSYGVGTNQDEAWQPVIVDIKGAKIGFIGAAYASYNDGGKRRNNFVARIQDLETLKSEISNLKSKADIIIVTMHAGTEYTSLPNETQKAFAHAAIDAGADLVVGHHPHWVQSIERYVPKCPSPGKGRVAEGQERLNCGSPKYIFYSLGNFIFDQEWSEKTKQGLVVKLTIEDKRLKQADLIPIELENYCCPRLANPEESAAILKSSNATSSVILLK